MNIFGADILARELEKPGYFFKALLGETGVVFFPGSAQHSSIKTGGLSYEDNYKGNAMAAVITDGRIEIRYHKAFPMAAASRIINELLGEPRIAPLKGFRVTYQKKMIREGAPRRSASRE